MTGAAAESHCSIGPHADMGTHRTDAIHTHTAAERSEMVKEPVSTPDARWVQAQLGVKLLTRTETMPGTTELSSPLTPRIARFRAFAEPSTSPHSLSGICRGCQTRERRGQRGTGRETWKEKDFQYVTDGQQA